MTLAPSTGPALVNTPVLETDRLILRAPELRDFDAYADFFATHRSVFVGGPRDRERAWPFFCHHVGHWAMRGYGTFCLEPKSGGPTLGMLMAWKPEGHAEREVGWGLFTGEAEGKGYATEAALAVLDHVFGTLGWDTAVSYIGPENARSIALAQRLGARFDTVATDLGPGKTEHVYRHPAPGVRQ